MKKICLFFLALLVSLNLSHSLAATFTLDRIGTLSTEGHRYSEWWYTGTTPTLSGKIADGTEVTVTIGEDVSEVTANSAGDWSFSPSSLATGDYDITISVDGDSYEFTLHLGQTMSASGTTATSETTQSTVPDTGVAQVFAILGGITALALGWYFLSNKKDSAFLE